MIRGGGGEVLMGACGSLVPKYLGINFTILPLKFLLYLNWSIPKLTKYYHMLEYSKFLHKIVNHTELNKLQI